MLVAASVVQPDIALLLLQGSALGLALTGAALWFERFAVKRPLPTVPVRGSSQAILEGSATEIYYRAAKTGPPTSTATAPAALQASEQNL
jgi:hypothetical protein